MIPEVKAFLLEVLCLDKAPYRLTEDSQVEPSCNQFPYLPGVIPVFTNSEGIWEH